MKRLRVQDSGSRVLGALLVAVVLLGGSGCGDYSGLSGSGGGEAEGSSSSGDDPPTSNPDALNRPSRLHRLSTFGQAFRRSLAA